MSAACGRCRAPGAAAADCALSRLGARRGHLFTSYDLAPPNDGDLDSWLGLLRHAVHTGGAGNSGSGGGSVSALLAALPAALEGGDGLRPKGLPVVARALADRGDVLLVNDDAPEGGGLQLPDEDRRRAAGAHAGAAADADGSGGDGGGLSLGGALTAVATAAGAVSSAASWVLDVGTAGLSRTLAALSLVPEDVAHVAAVSSATKSSPGGDPRGTPGKASQQPQQQPGGSPPTAAAAAAAVVSSPLGKLLLRPLSFMGSPATHTAGGGTDGGIDGSGSSTRVVLRRALLYAARAVAAAAQRLPADQRLLLLTHPHGVGGDADDDSGSVVLSLPQLLRRQFAGAAAAGELSAELEPSAAAASLVARFLSPPAVRGAAVRDAPSLTREAVALLVPALVQTCAAADVPDAGHGLGRALRFAGAAPPSATAAAPPSPPLTWTAADLAALTHLRVVALRLDAKAGGEQAAADAARRAAAASLAGGDRPGALRQLRRARDARARGAQWEAMATNASTLARALVSTADTATFAAALAAGTSALGGLQAQVAALVPGAATAGESVAAIVDAAADAQAEAAETDAAITASGGGLSGADVEAAALEAELQALMAAAVALPAAPSAAAKPATAAAAETLVLPSPPRHVPVVTAASSPAPPAAPAVVAAAPAPAGAAT